MRYTREFNNRTTPEKWESPILETLRAYLEEVRIKTDRERWYEYGVDHASDQTKQGDL